MFVNSGHLVMFVQTAPPLIVIYIIFPLTTPRFKLHIVVVASRYSKWHNVKHGLGFYPILYRRLQLFSPSHPTDSTIVFVYKCTWQISTKYIDFIFHGHYYTIDPTTKVAVKKV